MVKKKLLICGATGFIGLNILNKFLKIKDFEIHAIFHKRKPIDLEGVKWHKINLLKKKDVDKVFLNKDIIIQCAATTSGVKDIIQKPYIHITDNALMNSIMLRAAFEHKVSHFIFFSCSLMYHNSKKPLKEIDFDSSKEINSKYFPGAWNKIYFEKMCKFFSTCGETKYTVIRHSNVYGPYDKFDLEKSHVFGATVTKVFLNKEKVIVWGKGREKKDLLYIDDLVNFIKMAISNQKEKFELMNCGSGKLTSVKNLVEKIIEHSGKKLEIEFDESKPTVDSFVSLNCDYAYKKIGWRAKVDIDDGIIKTLDWYSKNYL